MKIPRENQVSVPSTNLDATREHPLTNLLLSFSSFPFSFVVLFSIVLRQLYHLHQVRPGFAIDKSGYDGLWDADSCCYSAFTETGATQTMKTNQMAELKQ